MTALATYATTFPLTQHKVALGQALTSTSWGSWTPHFAAADASHRSYWRLENPSAASQTVIVMVAPPTLENLTPFIRVGQLLRRIHLHAPEIYYMDRQAGILVLEDLGTQSYRTVLMDTPGKFSVLYGLFNEVMTHLHKSYRTNQQTNLALYSEQKLWDETENFLSWYCPHVGLGPFSKEAISALRLIHAKLVNLAASVPHSIVLRDAMIDNFLFCPNETGLARCGILDFQDALWGPVTYDLASMYHDARFDVPQLEANALLSAYLSAFDRLEKKLFVDSLYIFSTLRNLKILGVFARLAFRDNKPHYLKHCPRVWRYIKQTLTNSHLSPLKSWLDTHCPIDHRITPRYDAKNPTEP